MNVVQYLCDRRVEEPRQEGQLKTDRLNKRNFSETNIFSFVPCFEKQSSLAYQTKNVQKCLFRSLPIHTACASARRIHFYDILLANGVETHLQSQ